MNNRKNRIINKRILAMLLAVLMLAGMPAGVFAEPDDVTSESTIEADTETSVNLEDMSEDTAVIDELLVLVEEGTTKKEISGIIGDAGASLDNINTLSDGTKLVSVGLDDNSDAQSVADELISEDKVLIVQPNYIYRIDTADTSDTEIMIEDYSDAMVEEEFYNDNHQITQWYIGSKYEGAIRAEEAWTMMDDNNNDAVKVAVIDTGAKLDHPDLKDVILKDLCVTFNDSTGKSPESFNARDNSDDDDGHGTHVCGIIAANAADDFGIAGVSDNRAKLMVIDAAEAGTLEFTTKSVVRAIDYSVENGASVINMSIGALYRDYIMEDAVNKAYNKDVLCVCAAGNENSSLAESPGDAAGAISVMAHDESGNKAYFSNYGPEKDVSAPGVGIVSSYIGESDDEVTYRILSGTSMAAPVVSGIAAMILAENRGLNVKELKNLIYTSSGDGSYTSFGFGRVNSKSAIQNMKGSCKPGSIVLNRTSEDMFAGESMNLECAVYPGTASSYADNVTYESSNHLVAEVDTGGNITAISPGSAVITAKCKGVEAKCVVSVSGTPYQKISSLPYMGSGYFSPADPTLKISEMINGEKYEWEAMVDGYEVNLDRNKTVNISVKSRQALSFVRVYSPSGEALSVDQTIDQDKSKYYVTDASFKSSESGAYRIQIAGETDGSSTVEKPYTLVMKADGTKLSVRDATVTGLSDQIYNGKAHAPAFSVQYNGVKLIAGVDYSFEYSNNVNAGTAYITITGKDRFTGSAKVRFNILKASNTIAVSGKTATVKKSKLRRKARTIAISKLATIRNARGKLTYKKISGSGKLKINKSTGKVTVKKKTKKGKYKMVVRVRAAGNSNYAAANRYVTVTVRVK